MRGMTMSYLLGDLDPRWPLARTDASDSFYESVEAHGTPEDLPRQPGLVTCELACWLRVSEGRGHLCIDS